MAITVFTVYFFTLSALVWLSVIETVTGALIMGLVLGVETIAIVAAGQMTRR